MGLRLDTACNFKFVYISKLNFRSQYCHSSTVFSNIIKLVVVCLKYIVAITAPRLHYSLPIVVASIVKGRTSNSSIIITTGSSHAEMF